MGAALRNEDFAVERECAIPRAEPVDEQAIAKRIIVQVRTLLELAAHGKYVSEGERQWFASPPLMPDLRETSQRGSKVVKALAGGPPRICRDGRCQALFYMVTMAKSGKGAPYNGDGSPHWATCPGADEFRKQRGRR